MCNIPHYKDQKYILICLFPRTLWIKVILAKFIIVLKLRVRFKTSKGEANVTTSPCTPWRRMEGNHGIAPLVLNLRIWWGWVTIFTTRPTYSWRKSLQRSLNWDARWTTVPMWKFQRREKCLVSVRNRTTIPRISSPYPDHCTNWAIIPAPWSSKCINRRILIKFRQNWFMQDVIL
jgi:hypothetical protein